MKHQPQKLGKLISESRDSVKSASIGPRVIGFCCCKVKVIVMMLKIPRPMLGLKRLWLSESTRLWAMAAVIGSVTAVSIAVFHIGIEAAHLLFQEYIAQDLLGPVLGGLGLVIGMALAGAVVGWLMQTFVGHERHHGVTAIVESVSLAGGRLPYRKAPVKALAAVLSIGGGASVGPEDPSVQIGTNWASFLGQRMRLSEDHVRLLVAAGAAAAVAAAFRTPIAGVFFALEVILNGTFSTGGFGAIVLASVTASALTQGVDITASESVGPLSYNLTSPAEIALFIPLGIALAPVAAALIRLVHGARDWWKHHVTLPAPVGTALVGALVGIVGLFVPEILGTGRHVMNEVLSGHLNLAVGTLLIIGVVKIIMTTVSLAGGFVGGVFAPSLFIGTMLGAAYGHGIEALIPNSNAQAYAIAGMAGMMSGVLRAPMTAIMIVFELTNDYRLILPIMLTSIVCMFLAERITREGMYTFSLVRAGIHLRKGMELDVMQAVKVEEVMQTPAPTIHHSATLEQLRDTFKTQNSRSLCVLDDHGQLMGVVTLRDLQTAFEQGRGDTVGAISSKQLVMAYPDETVQTALNKMAARDVGRLPVVNPMTGELVGMFRRHHIVKAHNKMLTRRVEEQHRAEQLRLHTLTGAHVIELYIAAGAAPAGQPIHALDLPDECVIASVRRAGRLIVPHGQTMLRAGDVITLVAAPETEPELRRLFAP